MTLRNTSKILIILALVLVCGFGCKKQQSSADKKSGPMNIVVAKLQSVPTQLYYSGTVSPIDIYSVASPVDGNVQSIAFKYGDQVKSGQTLLVISSSKLQEDYRTSLTNFLKAKQDYLNSTVNFQGAQELMKAQIISEQDFTSEKSQYENTAIAYLNARIDLQQKIQNNPAVFQQIQNLSLDDIDTVSKILQTHYDTLPIVATHDGVALGPAKSDSDGGTSSGGGGGDAGKKIQVGSQVKQGQNLLSIGDLSGLSTSLQVSELVIDKIKPGQAVTVTIEAIPNMSLNGTVKSVSAEAQAAAGGEGGLAMYPVVVNVQKLTPEQTQLLRVGMSSKVQITIQNPPQILLPINAVTQKNNANVVTIIDPKTNKPKDVPVTTGPTTVDQVVITQGINVGDKVVVP